MTRSHLSRVLRAVGVALLPAAALLCCAGGANAECGGYVQIVGPDGKVQPAVGHDPMPAERPCQGPECTGGPKVPGPTSDVKGFAAVADGADGASSSARPAPNADGTPIRQPGSIFHPPRLLIP